MPNLFLTILAPKDGQLTWPRRRPISAVGSSAWTVQIRRSAAFLQKIPHTQVKSTRSHTSSLGLFFKKTLDFYQNQLAVRAFLWAYLLSCWAGLPGMGKKRPVRLFSFNTILFFLFKLEIFQNSYKIIEKS